MASTCVFQRSNNRPICEILGWQEEQHRQWHDKIITPELDKSTFYKRNFTKKIEVTHYFHLASKYKASNTISETSYKSSSLEVANP